jgi:FkbM family methyltransferase
MNQPKIIYDLGANNGDDIPYYLLKADLVVAVEANPVLAESIKFRFKDHIRAGRLFVENIVVTADGGTGGIDFFIHKTEHVLSQLGEPPPHESGKFRKERLPSRGVADIISQHGEPHYVKVDIESCDALILRALFSHGCFPPYISAEAHSIEVFSLLHAVGNYNAFKLVDGQTVFGKYCNRSIADHASGTVTNYSFPYNSAGPFGNDIDGPWWSADDFSRMLAFEILGWKDIHASNAHPPTQTTHARFRGLLVNYFLRVIKSKLTLKRSLIL